MPGASLVSQTAPTMSRTVLLQIRPSLRSSRRDDLLPVPLVDVDGVEVVHLLVAADGVHVGEEALAGVELVALQRQPLPLGQRMHHLRRWRVRPGISKVTGRSTPFRLSFRPEFSSTNRGAETRRRFSAFAQIRLEIALDKLDGALHFIDGQRRTVALRDDRPCSWGRLTFDGNSKIYTILYNSFPTLASGMRGKVGKKPSRIP